MSRVLLFLALLLAPACYQNTAYSPQPKMTRAPYLTEVKIRAHYVTDVDDILKVCKNLHGRTYVGCADLHQEGAEMVCDFYIQQPVDFNDEARLATAGHEIAMHCLGARHDV